MLSEPTRLPVPSKTVYDVNAAEFDAWRRELVEAFAEIIANHWLPRRPLTLEETAAFFGVSISTIRRWTVEGALDCWKYGNTVLYLPDHIAAFVAAGRTDGQDVAA